MTTNSVSAPHFSSRSRAAAGQVRVTGAAVLLTVLFCAGVACLAQTPPAGAAAAPAAPATAPIQIPGVTAPVAGTVGRTGSAPLPTAVSAPSGYQLSANDQIAVEVFGEDDLRTAARVAADGSVSLPLLGSVRLGGLTVSQATARLTELYGRDYLVNPKLNVSLVSYAKARFTILGQVNRPGSYEMPEGAPGGVDILDAIAMAGGYTRIAAPERITVRRTEAGGDQVIKVNAKKLARGSGSVGTFRVEPGDRITVGESIF